MDRSSWRRAPGEPAASLRASGSRPGGIIAPRGETMPLLERDGLLAQLQAQWTGACAGQGRLVFVEGEAGIGKTSLLRKFAQSVAREAPVYWGACEAMHTPR